MNSAKMLLGAIVMAVVLVSPVVAVAAGDEAADRSQPKAFLKDSVITTKVKSKLAAEHLASLAKVHVETDANGTVWLSGTVDSQSAKDKAVAIARGTENVNDVHSDIVVSER